jgi:hypothetical protein
MDNHVEIPAFLGYKQNFTDADAFGGAVLGATLDYMPMPGMCYAATHSVLKLGSLLVQHVEDAPHLVRGAMDEGVIALLMLLRPPRTAPLVNGIESGSADIALVPGGIEFVSSAVTSQSWAALTITRARLAELAEVAPLPIRSDGSVRILRLPEECATALAAAIRSTVTLIDQGDTELTRPDCAEGLAASMSDLLAEALTSDAALRSAPRATAPRAATRACARAYTCGRRLTHATAAAGAPRAAAGSARATGARWHRGNATGWRLRAGGSRSAGGGGRHLARDRLPACLCQSGARAAGGGSADRSSFPYPARKE